MFIKSILESLGFFRGSGANHGNEGEDGEIESYGGHGTGTGGNDSYVPVTTTVYTPPADAVLDPNKCVLFNKLKVDVDFKAKIANLKTKTNDTIEHGEALINKPDGTFETITGTPEPGKAYSVGFPNPDNKVIDIIIHTHYTGGLSIFSPDDIEQLYKIIKNSPADAGDNFLMVVVTPNNKVYGLTVTDKKAFLKYGSMYFTTDQLYEGFKNFYNNSTLDNDPTPGLGIKKDKTTNILQFLNLLKGSGLQLHQATNDLNTWFPLILSPTNSVISQAPCN